MLHELAADAGGSRPQSVPPYTWTVELRRFGRVVALHRVTARRVTLGARATCDLVLGGIRDPDLVWVVERRGRSFDVTVWAGDERVPDRRTLEDGAPFVLGHSVLSFSGSPGLEVPLGKSARERVSRAVRGGATLGQITRLFGTPDEVLPELILNHGLGRLEAVPGNLVFYCGPRRLILVVARGRVVDASW